MEVPRFREIPYCFSLCQRTKLSIIISTDRTNLPKVKETVGPDFPGDQVVKNLPANARDMGSIPGLGRFHMPWGN